MPISPLPRQSDPWFSPTDWDADNPGAESADAEQQRRWARAAFLAGGLPSIWGSLARPLRDVLMGLLELREGDRIFVIGEGNEPCGWVSDMRELVGPAGAVDAVEILRDGRTAVAEKRVGRNGKIGCWQWQYTAGIPDEHYDCVAVMQSAQHCDRWEETGPELVRIMKPGRRIVFAEMVIEGTTFLERFNSDAHIRQWYDKMFPTGRASASHYTGDELAARIGPHVTGPQSMEWHGIEMFWGRKPTTQRIA